jgi:hypothetical protein
MKHELVVAFDLEITKEIPEGADIDSLRPLGISCAALAANNSVNQIMHDNYRSSMSVSTAQGLVNLLMDYDEAKYTIVTWNGLKFDFDILAEESGMHDECVELALNSVDMMYQIFCMKGYPVAMQRTAEGMGLQGKTEGMSGKLAPILWRSKPEDGIALIAAGFPYTSKRENQDLVLEYVLQDSVTTLEIFEESQRTNYLTWIAKSGRINSYRLSDWRRVRELIDLPTPDQSWMTDPIEKESFTSWFEKKGVTNEQKL